MNLVQRDIASIRSQNFQRAYNWEVIMPSLLPILGEMVAPLIQSVDYEDYAMEDALALRDGAFQNFFANNLTLKPFAMTFMETEEAIVKLYFAAWKNKMLDRNGLWKNKIGGYAKDIVLLYLNAQGYPLREVKFVNAFPLRFYSAKLDYNTNEILKINIPFICDRVEEGVVGLTGLVKNPTMGTEIKTAVERFNLQSGT